MGENKVELITDTEDKNEVLDEILRDIKALKYIIDNGLIEDRNRIGAEQELCFIDKSCRPAPVVTNFLEDMDQDYLQTELARFNLEINTTPLEFTGGCFSKLEDQLQESLDLVEERAGEMDLDIILTGILPTIKKMDLTLENLTPSKRSEALIKAMNAIRKKDYAIRINGIDELVTRDFSNMFQSCNTSFQVHYQTNSKNFADRYNFAQLISAPVLAASTNSPILFGKRLWHETRIALFQQAVDTRDETYHLSDDRIRVPFGSDWLEKSIIELYKNDLANYDILLENLEKEDPLDKLKKGNKPQFNALQVFNGTIFRWNRACFGKSNEQYHLRIENRLMPSGPTLIDEVANAAFWCGLMHGMPDRYRELQDQIPFKSVRINLLKAARYGLNTQIEWPDEEKVEVKKLILEELLPIAREGLEKAEINKKDIDKYLGIIRDRTDTEMTGSQWQLNAWKNINRGNPADLTAMAITREIVESQKENRPVHEWDLPTEHSVTFPIPDTLYVEHYMSTDISSTNADTLIDKAAYNMVQNDIYHMPVCNNDGEMLGILNMPLLLEHYAIDDMLNKDKMEVSDIMKTDFHYAEPDDRILDTIDTMEANHIKCLPVLKNKKLVGIITEYDMMHLTKIYLS